MAGTSTTLVCFEVPREVALAAKRLPGQRQRLAVLAEYFSLSVTMGGEPVAEERESAPLVTETDPTAVREAVPGHVADAADVLSAEEFSSRFGWLADANPYRSAGGEHATNCVLSAIAVDMALEENLPRGRDTEPVVYQAPPSELAPYEHLRRYRDRAPVPVEDHRAVISIMREAGPLSRGMVVATSASGIDHVLNVVNDEGSILFLDGQTGRQVAASTLGTVEFLPVTEGFPPHLISSVLASGQAGRMIGGSGIASEYTVVLSLAGEEIYGMSGEVLATGPDGAALTVEEKLLYAGPSGLLYRTEQAALGAEGAAEATASAILEVIIGVNSVNDGESGTDLTAALERYSAVERVIDGITAPPGRQPDIPLSSLFPSPEWEFTELGSVAQIGPRPIGDWPGAHVHHNFGVPMAGVYPFLQHVAESTWRTRDLGYFTQDHLVDALEFARSVADGFSRSLPDHDERSLAELRGHAALLYDMTAALAHSELEAGELNKVHAAVLARHNLSDLLAALPTDVREYLTANADTIRGEFERLFRKRLPDYDEGYGQAHELPPGTPVDLFRVTNGYGISVGGYIANGLGGSAKAKQSVIWSTTTLDGLDTNGGRLLPMVVMEIRSYGRRHVTAQEAIRHHLTLGETARQAYAQAEQLAAAATDTAADHGAPAGVRPPAAVGDGEAETAGAEAVGAEGPETGAAEVPDGGAEETVEALIARFKQEVRPALRIWGRSAADPAGELEGILNRPGSRSLVFGTGWRSPVWAINTAGSVKWFTLDVLPIQEPSFEDGHAVSIDIDEKGQLTGPAAQIVKSQAGGTMLGELKNGFCDVNLGADLGEILGWRPRA